MIAIEHVEPSRRRPATIGIAVLSAALLVAASLLALRHSPSTKNVVVLPQATTTVTCGQVITVSITVGNDLDCPSGRGLIVGAKSITINLNGHVLSGNPSANGVDFTFSGVTIENGSVQGWHVGVVGGGAGTRVTGIRASQNGIGIVMGGTGSIGSGDVAFSNGLHGILVEGLNVKVTSSVVRQNGADGINIKVNSSVGAILQTNQAENNTSNGINDLGRGTTMTGNITNGNGSDGINSSADATSTVGTDTANFNGAFGIEAAAGGKDSGGNLAKGNTQSTQCKDVVCS